MQSAVALNVQQSIRPGSEMSTYYPGSENSKLQANATVEDNRFFVALPSLNSGSSSTVTFNPNEGLSEVIITLRLPDPGSPAARTGLALQEGWRDGTTMEPAAGNMQTRVTCHVSRETCNV